MESRQPSEERPKSHRIANAIANIGELIATGGLSTRRRELEASLDPSDQEATSPSRSKREKLAAVLEAFATGGISLISKPRQVEADEPSERQGRLEELGWVQSASMWPIELKQAVDSYAEREGIKPNIAVLRLVAEGLEKRGVELPERIERFFETQVGLDEARQALAGGTETSVEYLARDDETLPPEDRPDSEPA